MAQYIPKATIVAEIKRRIKAIPKDETDKRLKAVYGNEAFVLMDLLSFINDLEVKEDAGHYELKEFAKIIRGNLTGISKDVQSLFEAKYLQLTGNKMYGGYND